MAFFLGKTWLWLLLSALLAVLLSWLLTRRPTPAAAPAGAPVPAAGPAAAPTPPPGTSARGVPGGDADVVALRAEVEALRAEAEAGELLRTEVLSLRVDADRARGLEEEVRLLRVRLDGEDGQVAVLRRRIALLEAQASRVPELERALALAGRPPSTRTLGQVVRQAAGAAPDTDAARAVLGVPVRLDDLKVVEGIGPKIESLLHADGIRTWGELADTDVDRLRAVLTAAGLRYQLHDPGTWPEQARLLARGAWPEFAALTARLPSGR